MRYAFEIATWIVFGVMFVVWGASLVALVSAAFRPTKRLDGFQAGWLLAALVGSACIMWFDAVHLGVSFNYVAVVVGMFVGTYVWARYIEDGLELPHNETELFRS